MKSMFRALVRFIKYLLLIGFFSVLLMAGMAAGGFFLLDYLIRGQTVQVPNLYGLPKARAVEILIEHDLFPQMPVKEIPRDDLDPGIVIEQYPHPGSEVKKHRSITLVVSAWAGKIQVPNLVRQREDEILAELRASNLEVGLQAELHHPEYPKGTIIAQYPQPGLRFVKNRQIDLLISLGPEPQRYIMPKYVGKKLNEVLDDIRNKPFEIEQQAIRKRRTPNRDEWNQVLVQIPSPGALVQKGEKVTLVVGESGQSLPEMRLDYVQMPMPYGLFQDHLALLVWDESAKFFQLPYIFPIKQNLYQQSIQMFVPISGDSLVMLGIPRWRNGLLRVNPIIDFDYIQYHPKP